MTTNVAFHQTNSQHWADLAGLAYSVIRLRPTPPSASAITIPSLPVAWRFERWNMEERAAPGFAIPQPPSQVLLTPIPAVASELKQLSREELIALARKAKGSLKNTAESAVDIVRHLRDEWDVSVD